MAEEFIHDSVLLHQAVEALVTLPDGIYVDGTFGRGGHSRAILSKLSAQGCLFAFDKDPIAVAEGNTLAQQDSRFTMIHDSFAHMTDCLQQHGVEQVAGIFLDLGVSSPQLDDASRGFSFMQDGPLDMRMDNSQGMSAQQWITVASEKEIADVLWAYGEERFSRRIAKAIVAARQEHCIATTRQLAEIVKAANPKWEKHKHPATRSFQGIRIFINDELKDVESCLQQSVDLLQSEGRLVVISFHSLEDRIVKQFIREQEKGKPIPRHLPVQDDALGKNMKRVGKAIKPEKEEMSANNRARSAIMRIASKL